MTDTPHTTPEINVYEVEGLVNRRDWSTISFRSATIAHAYLKLHEENQRLRTALDTIISTGNYRANGNEYKHLQKVCVIAKEALKEHKE